jgi:hypothetical protein
MDKDKWCKNCQHYGQLDGRGYCHLREIHVPKKQHKDGNYVQCNVRKPKKD